MIYLSYKEAAMAFVDAIAGNTFPIKSLHS